MCALNKNDFEGMESARVVCSVCIVRILNDNLATLLPVRR